MNRALLTTNHRRLAVAAIPLAVALAACSPAATAPSWTFGPASPSGEGTLATPGPSSPEMSPEPVTAPPVTAPPAVTAPPEPVTAPPAVTVPPPETPAAVVLGTKAAPREIEVTMGNFLFDPGSITVRKGETIRFVVTNPTTVPHELVLGDAEDQEHHAEEMKHMASSGDGHHMDEPNRIEVKAGETGELTWTFKAAGELLMGCHVPGHWDAGMRGTIEVVRK